MTTKTKTVLVAAALVTVLAAISVQRQGNDNNRSSSERKLQNETGVPAKPAAVIQQPVLPATSAGSTLAQPAPISTVGQNSAVAPNIALTGSIGSRISQFIQGAPFINGTPDALLEPDTLGGNITRFRSDVEQVDLKDDENPEFEGYNGTMVFVPSEGRFYLVWQKLQSGSNTIRYYGPFPGDPYGTLGLPKPNSKNGLDTNP